jgi:hypothetical protein
MLEFFKDFGSFLKDRQKYWLVPLVLTLVSLGALIVFAEYSALAPFIYTLF